MRPFSTIRMYCWGFGCCPEPITWTISFFLYKKLAYRIHIRGFPGGIGVKNLPVNGGNAREVDLIPGLEEGMAAHANIPAWKIPWTEEPGGL